MKEADGGRVCAVPSACRVAPIKISLDCTQFIANFTDAVGGRAPGCTQKTYRLQRKDELRLQLRRKPPSVERTTDGVGRWVGEREVPPRKKRKSGAGKRSKNPTKNRRKVDGGVPSAPGQEDSIVLNSLSLASEKNVLRSFGILPPHGRGFEEPDIYPRSSYSRKRRVPSITVTPSPVVFDTEISTYPYGKAFADRKVVSRSPRRRTTTAAAAATSGGKLPKVVSISTIPPTFVLTSTMKTEDQGLEKASEGRGGGKPTSLKLYLKMTDDRKKTALQMHDAVDDCFMVSSTVADEEEYAGSGSSAEMSPDSAANGRREADELAAAAAAAKMADQPRSSCSAPVVVVATSNVGSSLETVNPGSADQIRISSASKESPGPLYGGDLFSGTRAAAGTLSSLSSSGVPGDVGMKRRRLESVISSLKPVASVAVSTGHCQGVLQSARPGISHGTTTTTTTVALPAFYPTHASVVRRFGPPGNRPPRSLLSQLVCREPLNIPKPPPPPPAPNSRGLLRQPAPRTGIFTPTQLNHAVYGIRANGAAFRNPPSAAAAAAGQRQCRPRAPRRPSLGPPSGGHLRHPFDGAGVRFQNHSLVVPMLPHWQLPYRQALKPCPTYSGTIRIPEQLSEANGYDTPLELTTKKRSRDALIYK